jgi:hypothetical protein
MADIQSMWVRKATATPPSGSTSSATRRPFAAWPLTLPESSGVRRHRQRDAAGGSVAAPILDPGHPGRGSRPLRVHDMRRTAVALWIAARANPKQIAA